MPGKLKLYDRGTVVFVVPHSGTDDSVFSESRVIRTFLLTSDAGFTESVRVNLALEFRGSLVLVLVSAPQLFLTVPYGFAHLFLTAVRTLATI
jgi:hypothetical protein